MRYLFTVFLAISCTFLAMAAHAQGMSGRGMRAQDLEQTCKVKVTTLRDGVEELRELTDAILNCHRNGQVYDGGACRDVAMPAHAWEDGPGNAIHLKLQEGTVVTNLVTVTKADGTPENFRGPKGDNGANAVCPGGTCAVGTACP